MSLGQRIKNLRTSACMTQQDLADSLNVSSVAVRNWEYDIKKPSMDAIISLTKVFDISSDILLGIDSNATNNSLALTDSEREVIATFRNLDRYGKNAVLAICRIEHERISNSSQSNTIKFSEAKFIPCYATPAAAGTSIPLDSDDFEMIVVNDDVPSDADYAVNIQGNSMYPYIRDKDRVYVKKVDTLSVGDIGIFCVDGAIYCKHYYKDVLGNLILVSANPDYKESNVYVDQDGGQSVKLLGKVLLNTKPQLPDYIFE